MAHRIIVLSAHTDDMEFGCGGAVARFARKGYEVHHLAFSTIHKDQREHIRNILRRESTESATLLGCASNNIYEFDMRQFPEQRQDILAVMWGWNEKKMPEMVFLPSSYDTHQDHEVVRQEGFRAFKNSTILGYELPWNNLDFSAQAFVPLTVEQLQKKLDAINCYESQRHYHYFDEDYVRSLARARGGQIKVKYAESFEVIRWIL